MTHYHTLRLLKVLRELGVTLLTSQTWHFERREGVEKLFVHGSGTCSAITGEIAYRGELTDPDGTWLCADCTLSGLDPDADHTTLRSEAWELVTAATWLDAATSTFHVVAGEKRPALHAAIVHDTVAHFEGKLAAHPPHPALASARNEMDRRLASATERFPYDPAKVTTEALREAVRWTVYQELDRKFWSIEPLTLRGGPLRGILTAWLDGSTDVPSAHARMDALRSEHQEFFDENPAAVDATEMWLTTFEAHAARTGLRYYSCGGLSSGMHSVPRTAREHLLRSGIRITEGPWGFGVLPEIVIEWLAGIAGEKCAKAHLLDGAYHELDDDQWMIAMALWKEHRVATDSPYRHQSEAVAAAASL